jgi:uncharacterized protein
MQNEVVVERDVRVTMRDGIQLACDVYRPARDGQPVTGAFPVILERTPYDKGTVSRSEITAREPKEPKRRQEVAAFFTRHGYVVIYQDCRGRYGSEGVFRKYLDEAADGYDTCAWIVQQPWCNGRIGTMGLSYAAHTQAALASLNPPGLAAMFVDSGGFSNAYQSGIRQGGAFELKQATWAYKQALKSPSVMADPERRAALEAVDLPAWFADMPWRPGHSPVTTIPEYEDYLFEQWTHGAFDDYWAQPGIYVDFGPEATLDHNLAPDFLTMRLRWFDRWLRGVENGVETEPAVRVFVMGGGSGQRNAAGRLDHGGHWRQAATWPLPETRFTRYYCHSDGSLAPELPAPAAEPLTYRYDPKHPVPTIGGPISSGEPMMVGGAFDQREAPDFFGSRAPYRPLAERPDVLVFQTAPLDLNFNTGEPEGLSTHARVATNAVYVDASRPSHVVLPLIPMETHHG